MEAILDILLNLFEGADVNAIIESLEGTLADFNVSSFIEPVTSFFGGLLG